jgi:release factor glutamine methyltransferase
VGNGDRVTITVAQALDSARAAGLDALDAQVLLAKCLDRPRAWLLAHGEMHLEGPLGEAFCAFVARRAGGEPLAYLTGEKEFRGLLLAVGPAVLIPRPETEHLVDWGLEILNREFADVPRPLVLDLGTGSGAIALALKAAHPAAQVEASDADPQALAVAQRNAKRLALDVQFRGGDWWSAIGNRKFHLVLCNPPYIARADSHLASLAHEPVSALTPGIGGMEALHCVVLGAPAHLHTRGWLLLEHGYDQAEAVRNLMQRHGFAQVQTRQDLARQPRCTGGSWLGR